jgi:Tol biopolymer transport system component
MRLAAGSKLGPYEIQSALGAGGMGEVYRARDTRLERTVAIKILPAHLSSDPVRRQRFEREAKTISRLNHPHICVLYDIGHQEDVDYLVMECVEGESLAQRLTKGPLPLEQVLKYGAQIADALGRAHRSGVVHRDLKPGNIMLAPTGAKLLDFGLAKPVTPLGSDAALTAETKSSPVTAEGSIVGTFQYMSPEQVEGKELDGRSDIFSLGAVLYEMLTGQRAFAGESQLSVASAILEKEPAPIHKVKPLAPPALDHAVKKCLAKTAEERWQSANDLASELRWIAEGGGSATGAMPVVAAKKTRDSLGWIVAGALAMALIAGVIWWRNAKSAEQAMQFSAPLPFSARDLVFSPNGHTLAVVAYRESARKNALWVYEVGSPVARNLAETEGASYPFWSPDGRFVAFFADGKLKKADVSGGQVQTICDAPSGRGGTWNKDGVIILTPSAQLGEGLYRVAASGGTPTALSKPDSSRGEQSHRYPLFLPDGRHFLYLAANFTARQGINAIFEGSFDSNEKRMVVESSCHPGYAAPGYLLYCRQQTLLAQRFDPKSLALGGEATVVLTDIQYSPQVRRAVFAASGEGALVAQTGNEVALSKMTWFDRKGKELGAVGQADVHNNVSLSPDGRFLAVDKTDMGSLNTNVWTYDLQRDSAKRLTFDPAFDVTPAWSPDGSRIVFASNRQLRVDLYMKNADGAQQEKSVVSDNLDKLSNDWSRDGKYILYTRGPDLWSATLPEFTGKLYVKAVSSILTGKFSPDGKWVAYASNETGKWEIYVTSFPEPRGKWQVSTGGGEQPRWRGDGKELFYLSSDSKVMAVPVTTGANFDAGPPVVLFQATPRLPVSVNDQFSYDVSRDGQRFLILTQVKQGETTPMTVVLNWAAMMNK